MGDSKKTKKTLSEEVQALRSRVAQLERMEVKYKQAEQALQASEQRYAKAEQIGSFGHWERDLVRNTAAWSEECYRICGVDPDRFEPSYENYLSLIHPSDRQLFEDALKAALSQSKAFDVEYRVVRPDGSQRIVHSVAEVRLDEAGRPVSLVGTAHDVTERKVAEQALRKARDELEERVRERTASLTKTNVLLEKQIAERKRAENALRQSEEKWRSLVESAPDVILTVDPNGTILFLNRTVPPITPQEAIGMSIYDYVPPEHRDMLRQSLQRVLQTGEPQSYEVVGTGPHGRTSWYQSRMGPVKHEGKVVAVTLVATDITDHKRAQQDLMQSEEKYRSVIENIGIGVSLISPKMEILALNRQLREWFPDIDVSKKPICYKFFNEPPREHVCSYCPTYKSLKDGQVHESITETPAGDRIVNYRIVSSPIKDEDGRVIAAIEMVEDITEQKRAEQALRESEQRHKAMFEGAAEGIVVADIETKKFKYANPAICKMLGYTEEELTHMGVWDVHPKEHLEHVISEFEAQARGEKTLALDIPCLRKDGTVVYADIDTARVMIDGRECNVGFFTDITERKKAQEGLARAEAKYRTLVEQIPAVTYVAALDRASTTLYISPQIETLIGFSPEGYKKDPDIWRKRLHPDDSERVMAEVERTHETGEPLCCEYRMVARDGHVVWCRDEAALVKDSNNQPLFLQGIMLDITERKQWEQELQKARDELEVRVQQRTADLAEAMQELRSEITERRKAEEKLLLYRNQLRSLAAELFLAEERLRRKIATDVHDNISQHLAISKIKLEALRKSVSSQELAGSLEEVGELVAQAIESSRFLTFELSPPVLYELGFEAAVEWLVRQTRQRHGLATEFKNDGRAKPLDHNVRVLLFQAVRELLVNVVKHAQAGNITVSTRRVGDKIEVSVEDDGVGFDASRAGSQGYKSGGFGLFSIRERLGHIGGRLDIESRPKKGTRITLIAPLNHEGENGKEIRK